MKIKVTFLLFVFGAVAVFAEKEGSQDNQNEYSINISTRSSGSSRCPALYYKPGRKELVCGPPLKPSELPPELQTKEFIERLFKFFGKQIQDHSVSVLTKFEKMVKEINDKKKQTENSMESKLQTAEINLKAELNDDIKEAEEEGQDENKIKECLGKHDIRIEMKNDTENTKECLDYAAEEVREAMEKFIIDFNKTIRETFDEVEKQKNLAESCSDPDKNDCIQKCIFNSNQSGRKMNDLAELYLEKAGEVLEKEMKVVETCSEKFFDDLGQVEDAFYTLLRHCMMPKPEDFSSLMNYLAAIMHHLKQCKNCSIRDLWNLRLV